MDNNSNINNVKVFTSSNPNNNASNDNANNGKTVFFIDPLNNLPVDNTELVIYVDLIASKRARSILLIDKTSNKNENNSRIKSVNGSNSEINLIGYRQPNGDTKFMSTDWSKKPNFGDKGVIGTQTDLSGGDVFEGFGLESIDINITAMNPPTVTIKFIDTRGGGLFDQEIFNQNVSPNYGYKNNSPYSLFFEMPPPLFYLNVKGYYGNPVELCLYMTKWDGTFNSETGNFEMNAQFLGYTFAFLQDIKVGHLIGAGNTDDGRSKLVKVSNIPTEEGYTFSPITLDDLVIKFQRITVKREEEQKNSKEFQKLKVINEQVKYITQFRSYLGYPALTKSNNTLFGPLVDTTFLKPITEQLFFRDVGIFKNTKKNDADSDGDVEKKYKEFTKLIDDLLQKYAEFKNKYPNDFYSQGDLTRAEINFPKEIEKLTKRNNLNDALIEVNRLLKENEPDIITLASIEAFSGNTKGKWPIDSGFYIINLKNTRDNIDKKLENLKKYKNLIEEEIQKKFDKEVTDILGFEPNIRNIMGILCNNIEMFLELIHDCGLEAENNNGEGTDDLSPRRLNLGGFKTDSPDANGGKEVIYAFPKVVDNDYKEIFLGEILTIDKLLFPEIDFVNGLCDGLVYSIKEVTKYNNAVQNTQQISVLLSFPINERDLGINPYTNLDGLPSRNDGSLNREVVSTIIRRAFISYAMSKYKGSALNKIAELEAINFYETLVSDVYKNLFNQITGANLLDLALSENYLIITDYDANNYKFETSLYPKSFDLDNLGTTNSGRRQWSYNVNLKDEIKKSLNLSQKDSAEIKKFTSPKRTETYVDRFFDITNCFLNKSYLTLKTFKLDRVKNKIKDNQDLKSANLLESFDLNKLRIIDNGNGQLTNTSESNYFLVPRTVQNITPIPFTLSSIYNDTINDYGKAYLILSSFLFETDKILDDEIDDDYTKIIRLPWFYLLWLGANAYRKNNGEILNFNTEFNAVPTSSYYYVTLNSSEQIVNLNLISRFQKYFEDWVNGPDYFLVKDKFETLFNVQDLGENVRINLTNYLNTLLFNEYDLLIYDSVWMRKGDAFKDETLPKDELVKYLNTFISKYNALYAIKPGTNSTPKKDTEPVEKESVVNDKDIKLSFYLDIKHIYDNWIAGNKDSSTYSCCKTTKQSTTSTKFKLFDMFKFVDKFRNETAGDAIININSFNNLVNNRANGLYSFISKVLTDCYFMHFNLPFYLEFTNAKEIQKIFEPQLTFENIKNRPSFLCVYNGPPSNTLASTSHYGDDSFLFNKMNEKGVSAELPKALFDKKENEKSHLVAFNVNYGSQTQSIFKNVNVSTQESKITGEYITLLSDYVQGTGSAKPLLKDNSIYPLMRNRSYTATIQMMGDMMIQPQMYFQLNNIPFFSGAYMVMNVSHQIRANTMTTTFKGVRQNRSPVTIITKPTSFLNFQFNQGIESGITVTNAFIVKDQVKETQAEKATSLVDTKVAVNYAPTTGNKILRTFSTANEYHQGIDISVTDSTTEIFSVDKKGTVFENFKGTEELYGRLIIKHDVDQDGYTYFTGYFGMTDNNYVVGSTVIGKTRVGLPSNFYATRTVNKTVQPSQPNAVRPNYTFTINGTANIGYTALIYNNGTFIGRENYVSSYGQGSKDNNGNPITPEEKIRQELEFQANYFGFSFDEDLNRGVGNSIYFYPSYSKFDEQQSTTPTPTTETAVEQYLVYYYHYEVKRTKANITTYEQYRNSPDMEAQDPQKFAPNLEISLESKAIHDNTIYDPLKNKTNSLLPDVFLSKYEYSDDGIFKSLEITIDPSKGLWVMFSVEESKKITAECDGSEGYVNNSDLIFDNGQRVFIQLKDIVYKDCLNSENRIDRTNGETKGFYRFEFKVWASPILPDGKTDNSRRQTIKSFKVSFTI